MTKRDKIVYGSLITVGIITTLIIILRKKKPKLSVDYINWEGKYADISFGNEKARVSPFSNGILNAGEKYIKGYTLSYVPFEKDKVRLITKFNNKDLSEEIIEFESRLTYTK